MNFDAVVFDMDGVIFDSEKVVLECWLRVIEGFGIENFQERYVKCIGTNRKKTRQIMLDAFGQDFPFKECDARVFELFHERCDGGRLPVKPGVREILPFLRESGKKLALASSSGKEAVIRELGEAGLLGFFDTLVSGDMVTRSKPAPDIFLKACDMLGTDPALTIAIEDSYNGVRSASDGGLITIMVPDLLPGTAEMEKIAYRILGSMGEVHSLLAEEMKRGNGQ